MRCRHDLCSNIFSLYIMFVPTAQILASANIFSLCSSFDFYRHEHIKLKLAIIHLKLVKYFYCGNNSVSANKICCSMHFS